MVDFRFAERAYRTAIAANRALLRASSEADFTHEICRVATETAGYRLAWVGYAEHDARKSVRACAQHGFDDGYVGLLDVTWDEDERGMGPTGKAIRTGKPQIAQRIETDPRFAPWRADALRRGYASSAAFPLRDGDSTFGALNLYAAEPDAFGDEETELLRVVADDLAHGLLGLRGRRAFSEIEGAIEHADRLIAVGRAAAILAHDVNNHLTVAQLAIEHVAADAHEHERSTLREAIGAIERAVALNRDLLRVAGKAPVEPKRFVVNDVLRELEPALRLLCGSPIELRLELSADGESISMDPRAFQQMLTNVVANARDALAAGGSIRIGTTAVELRHPMPQQYVELQPGRYVCIRVTDTGTGMPPEVLSRVFESFFTTKGEHGTGLGLASALGSAQQAGGSVSVASELGRGTSVEILLPCGRAHDAA